MDRGGSRTLFVVAFGQGFGPTMAVYGLADRTTLKSFGFGDQTNTSYDR